MKRRLLRGVSRGLFTELSFGLLLSLSPPHHHWLDFGRGIRHTTYEIPI
jgi:hypothetical protein